MPASNSPNASPLDGTTARTTRSSSGSPGRGVSPRPGHVPRRGVARAPPDDTRTSWRLLYHRTGRRRATRCASSAAASANCNSRWSPGALASAPTAPSPHAHPHWCHADRARRQAGLGNPTIDHGHAGRDRDAGRSWTKSYGGRSPSPVTAPATSTPTSSSPEASAFRYGPRVNSSTAISRGAPPPRRAIRCAPAAIR